MKKGVRIAIIAAASIGLFAIGKYFLTQFKLLKEICVTNTTLAWRSSLVQAISQIANGSPTSGINLPFTLSVDNSSKIDVEIREIDLDIYLGTTHVGYIYSNTKKIVRKNSISDITVNIGIDDDLNIAEIGAATNAVQNAFEEIGQWLGLNETGGSLPNIEVRGNIEIKASIYEVYNYPYRMVTNVSEGNPLQESGNCGQ